MTFDQTNRRVSNALETDNSRDPLEGGEWTSLQNLLDCLPNPIVYRDNQQIIRACNRNFQELFQGRLAAELAIPADLLESAAPDASPEPSPLSRPAEQEADRAMIAALGLDYRVDHVIDRRPNGSVAGFFTILSDHSVERDVRQYQARLDATLRASG